MNRGLELERMQRLEDAVVLELSPGGGRSGRR